MVRVPPVLPHTMAVPGRCWPNGTWVETKDQAHRNRDPGGFQGGELTARCRIYRITHCVSRRDLRKSLRSVLEFPQILYKGKVLTLYHVKD